MPRGGEASLIGSLELSHFVMKHILARSQQDKNEFTGSHGRTVLKAGFQSSWEFIPAIPQQQNMMQNSEGPHAPLNMEPGFVKTRRFIQDRIYESLMQRQQTREIAPKNMLDIVRRLEEGLFKTATTKEEYMNLETLENRLQILIRRLPLNNHNQRYQQQNNTSVAMGTMIPTPGVAQSGNSSLMVPSSRDSSLVGPGGGNSMMSSGVNAGSFSMNTTGPSRGMHSGSFGSEGGLTDGGQQSLSNFSVSSGGNSFISSTGAQRMASQMMPTPGYNNNANSTNNQSYMKMEPSTNVSTLSGGVDSTMVSQSQPLQQKQQVGGGQNSRILHSLGSHMGGGIRSTLNQSAAYGFSNGSLNGNLGMMGKSSQAINSLGTSEGFLRDSHYGNSVKPVQQYFDQHQGQMSQGDGYGSGTADSGRSGNFYAPTTSATSLMNINPVNLPALQGTNSSLVVNHSNLHNADHPVTMKPSVDQSEEMDFRSQHLLRESAANAQQPLHFQQQLLRSQRQQKQQNQRLPPYGQSQMISDLGVRIKAEPGMERHNETLQPQAYDQFQSSSQAINSNSFQQNSGEDHNRASQLRSLSSGSQQDMCLSMAETSEQLQQPHFGVDPRNDLISSIGVQPDALLQGGQWHSRSQEASHELGNLSNELHIQEEFRQGKIGHDQGQRNNLSSESMNHQMAAKRSVDQPDNRSATLDRGLQYRYQKRWLLFLFHARSCTYAPGKCPEVNCITVQNLLNHITSCNVVTQCQHPRCHRTKTLLQHYKSCRDQNCPVCVPVKLFLIQKGSHRTNLNPSFPQSGNGSSCDYSLMVFVDILLHL
ncbi:hypothetical protein OSB04_003070 [Centaurea solstitialis]|uniref:histone acetyltransferase n=1 Tax=Centaurea solstitialis TaxID=347529 RepID=A0AA38TUH0_9ASTR|nr:hypothetical protein OSB04_003070 [Centaurea solstitialis]